MMVALDWWQADTYREGKNLVEFRSAVVESSLDQMQIGESQASEGEGDIRMENIVDCATVFGPSPTMRHAEVQPLIRLHLRTTLSHADP